MQNQINTDTHASTLNIALYPFAPSEVKAYTDPLHVTSIPITGEFSGDDTRLHRILIMYAFKGRGLGEEVKHDYWYDSCEVVKDCPFCTDALEDHAYNQCRDLLTRENSEIVIFSMHRASIASAVANQ